MSEMDSRELVDLQTIEELKEQLEDAIDSRDFLRAQLDEYNETHMPLPLDADGVPIHVGDYLSSGEYAGERFECIGLSVEQIHGRERWSVAKKFNEEAGCVEYTAAMRCRHVKPRTVEDVLATFRFDAKNIYDDPTISGNDRVDELEALDEKVAAELRELMEVEQ